jgi:hypothetical protein
MQVGTRGVASRALQADRLALRKDVTGLHKRNGPNVGGPDRKGPQVQPGLRHTVRGRGRAGNADAADGSQSQRLRRALGG